MEKQGNRFIKNLGLVIAVILQLIALVTLFNKMDARLADLENWRKEVQDTRVTIKDMYLIEEKMKHMDSKISDIKESVKEINQKLK